MTTISEHRKFLNDTLLPKWAGQFHEDDFVYDIGKSITWNYKPYFECKYRTVDRYKSLKPDIHMDLETVEPLNFFTNHVGGILFNGVFEQCDNPFKVMNGIKCLLKNDGLILAGLASNGMEPYGESDKWRVTKDGAIAYMKDFKILEIHEFPAYIYILGKLR